MKYKILKDGDVVNTIVSDLSFIEKYCSENDLTFEEIEEVIPSPVPDPAQETTIWDELDAAYQKGVNSAYDS